MTRPGKPLLILIAIAFLSLALACFNNLSHAQDSKAATAADPHPVPGAISSALLSDYSRILFYQSEYNHMVESLCTQTPQCKSAREKLQSSVADYNAALPQRVKESGLPAGSQFDINVDARTVKAVVPAAAPEAHK